MDVCQPEQFGLNGSEVLISICSSIGYEGGRNQAVTRFFRVFECRPQRPRTVASPRKGHLHITVCKLAFPLLKIVSIFLITIPPKVRCIIQTAMNFRNLFVSLFLILAIGLVLVQADEAKQPRGPKITSKVIYFVIDCRACIGKNIS